MAPFALFVTTQVKIIVGSNECLQTFKVLLPPVFEGLTTTYDGNEIISTEF